MYVEWLLKKKISLKSRVNARFEKWGITIGIRENVQKKKWFGDLGALLEIENDWVMDG